MWDLNSEVLSKLHFLKAAARLGFAKESKELWKALDKDDSGAFVFEESTLKRWKTCFQKMSSNNMPNIILYYIVYIIFLLYYILRVITYRIPFQICVLS